MLHVFLGLWFFFAIIRRHIHEGCTMVFEGLAPLTNRDETTLLFFLSASLSLTVLTAMDIVTQYNVITKHSDRGSFSGEIPSLLGLRCLSALVVVVRHHHASHILSSTHHCIRPLGCQDREEAANVLVIDHCRAGRDSARSLKRSHHPN